MELHDRILNIKKLLKYCSNQEIEIYEKKSGKFFHDNIYMNMVNIEDLLDYTE